MKKILGVGAGQKWIGSATLVKLQFLAQDVRQVRVFLLQYSYYIFISSGGFGEATTGTVFLANRSRLWYMESPIC